MSRTAKPGKTVRVVLFEYQRPDRARGQTTGRYRAIPGFSKSLPARDDRAVARLFDTISNAADLWHADELVGHLEEVGAVEIGEASLATDPELRSDAKG